MIRPLFHPLRVNGLFSWPTPRLPLLRRAYSTNTRLLSQHRHQLLLRLVLFSACSFSLGLLWVYQKVQKKKSTEQATDTSTNATLQSMLPLREKEQALGSILEDLKKRRTWEGQLERYLEHLKLFADQYYHIPGCLLSEPTNDTSNPNASLKNWFASLLRDNNKEHTESDEKQNWQQFVDQYKAHAALQSKESFSWTPPMLLFNASIAPPSSWSPSSTWDKWMLQSMAWTEIWPLSQLLSSTHQESKKLVAWFHQAVAPAARAVDAPHTFALSILEPPLQAAASGPAPRSRLGLIFQCLKEAWNDSMHWPLTCYPTLPLCFDSQLSDADFITTFASMYGLDAPVLLGRDVYALFNDLYLQGAESYQTHWIANEWKTQPLLFLHNAKEKKWTSSPLRFVFYWQGPTATASSEDTERRWLWLSRMNGLVEAILSAELGQVWIVNVNNDARFSQDWHTLYSKSGRKEKRRDMREREGTRANNDMKLTLFYWHVELKDQHYQVHNYTLPEKEV